VGFDHSRIGDCGDDGLLGDSVVQSAGLESASFVSGHDFSRAEHVRSFWGFSPRSSGVQRLKADVRIAPEWPAQQAEKLVAVGRRADPAAEAARDDKK
jgi:hypothetical protein